MASRRAPERTAYRIAQKTLVVDLGSERRILSSAVWGGGFVRRRYVLNHQVAANPVRGAPGVRRRWPDPVRTLRTVARRLALGDRCVGLMTAVDLQQLVVRRVAVGDVRIEGFLTVGLTNAVRAGEPPAGAWPGTINIIVVTNARLSASAMVTAVQVVTEAKTAALHAAGVRSWRGSRGATGTGTDTVCVVAGHGPPIRYGGTHTAFGAHLARLVRDGMRVGIGRWRRWRLSS